MNFIELDDEELIINGIEFLQLYNVKLFSVDASLRLLKYFSMKQIGILGIEGFLVEEEMRTPDMQYIFDASDAFKTIESSEFVSISIKGARNFLTLALEHDPHLMFEFVLVA